MVFKRGRTPVAARKRGLFVWLQTANKATSVPLSNDSVVVEEIGRVLPDIKTVLRFLLIHSSRDYPVLTFDTFQVSVHSQP
jgi:hypothetical protein